MPVCLAILIGSSVLRRLLHSFDLADHPNPWHGPEGMFFQSDFESTMKYLQQSEKFSDDDLQELERHLGNGLSATVNGRDFQIYEEYVEEVTHSRLIRRSDRWLRYRIRSALYGCIIHYTVFRDESPNAYWVSSDWIPDLMERYQAISEVEFYQLARADGVAFDHNGVPIVTPPSPQRLKEAKMLRKILS